MQLSESALNAQLNAIGELLSGGRLCVYESPQSKDPLVQFAVKSVSKATGGEMEVTTEEACIARREGTAQRYAWLDKGGKVVATGDVGQEFQVTPSYLVNGTRAMVDKIVWRMG